MSHADEIARFQARLREVLNGRATSKASKEIGFPRTTMDNWLAADAKLPRMDRLMELAEKVGKPLAWFFTDPDAASAQPVAPPVPANDDETVRIPLMDATAAAGAGSFSERVKAIAHLPFPRFLFSRRSRNPDRIHAVRCKGESMEPTIEDGALVFYDHRETAPPKFQKNRKRQTGEMYVFLDSGEIRLKRIYPRQDGSLMLVSDNVQEFEPELVAQVETGRIRILGKVIWWDNRL